MMKILVSGMWMKNSVDPDQLASLEASFSGSGLQRVLRSLKKMS